MPVPGLGDLFHFIDFYSIYSTQRDECSQGAVLGTGLGLNGIIGWVSGIRIALVPKTDH